MVIKKLIQIMEQLSYWDFLQGNQVPTWLIYDERNKIDLKERGFKNKIKRAKIICPKPVSGAIRVGSGSGVGRGIGLRCKTYQSSQGKRIAMC